MEKFNEAKDRMLEKTIIFNQETEKAFLAIKTTGRNMVEDIHQAFEEMQQIAGIEEKE